ncbi:hypothetical protein ACG9Y7_04135 [Acinetobacter gerneri]|uniref:hypothetical protein n=1 Tax=Acinetobacter gerneri TaxID=202952 RepID=UPI003AF9DAF8
MAHEMDGVNIAELHQCIEREFSKKFPQFKLIKFYREEEERRAPDPKDLPALLLEIPEFELNLDEDSGTEQMPLVARIEARIIDTFNQRDAKIKIRALAVSLAYFLYKNKRFYQMQNKAAGHVVVETITEDNFFQELDRYEVWRVDFSLPINIGDNIWSESGVTPTPVYSYDPKIGLGYEDSYKDIL